MVASAFFQESFATSVAILLPLRAGCKVIEGVRCKHLLKGNVDLVGLAYAEGKEVP